MLKFEWNALRPGDNTLVHDSASADLALTPGVVAHVEVHRGGNGVGIRVGAGASRRILWPSSLAVHRDPPESGQSCWRCQERGERAKPAALRDGARQATPS